METFDTCKWTWLTVCWVMQWYLWPDSTWDERQAGKQIGAAAQRQSVPRGWQDDDDDVFICKVVQNIPQSAQHVTDGVNADKSDVMVVGLLGPPVCWRIRLAIYGRIFWLCLTPLSTLQLRGRNLFTDYDCITRWQSFHACENCYNSSRYSAAAVGV